MAIPILVWSDYICYKKIIKNNSIFSMSLELTALGSKDFLTLT